MKRKVFKAIICILEMTIYVSLGYFMVINLIMVSKPPIGASMYSYICSLIYIIDVILHYILIRKAETKLQKIIIIASVFSDAVFGVWPAIMAICLANWLCFFIVGVPVLLRLIMQIILLKNSAARDIFRMEAGQWRMLILCLITCLVPLLEFLLSGGSAFLTVVATGILLISFINKHIINRFLESQKYLACYSQCCILTAIPSICIAIAYIANPYIDGVEIITVNQYFFLIAEILILSMGVFELIRFFGKEQQEQ